MFAGKGEVHVNYFAKTVLAAVCLLFVFSVCQAGILGDIQPGVRGGYYFNKDGVADDSFFLGADLKIKVVLVNADPNIEYVFVDNAKFWAFNLDGFINLVSVPLLSVFVGGGVGLLYVNPDNFDSSTDGCVNLLAGLELGGVPLSPYLMAKYVFKPDEDISVIGIGVRF